MAERRRGEAGVGERRKGRQRLEVAERRAQLVALGLERFGRTAYDEVSIDDLARAAGISKGLLYHYFPTKRDYYVATVRAAAEQLLAASIPSPELPPLERLDRGLDAYLEYVERHGAAYVSLMRGGIGIDREVQAIIEETRRRFAEKILDDLPLEKPNPLVRLLLRGWIGMVETVSVEWAASRDVGRVELRDLLGRILIEALDTELGWGLAEERHLARERAKR